VKLKPASRSADFRVQCRRFSNLRLATLHPEVLPTGKSAIRQVKNLRYDKRFMESFLFHLDLPTVHEPFGMSTSRAARRMAQLPVAARLVLPWGGSWRAQVQSGRAHRCCSDFRKRRPGYPEHNVQTPGSAHERGRWYSCLDAMGFAAGKLYANNCE
jgi:hypothetical protein